MMNKNKTTKILMTTLSTLVCALATSDAWAQGPQPLLVSKGVYRLPYADNTTVRFSNDHTNHPASLNRIDMTGQPSSPTSTYTVVAAGAGWVRVIQDSNFTTCPNACGSDNDCDGDGILDNQDAQDAACQSYNGPAASCCERDFEENGGVCPNGGTCQPAPNDCSSNIPNNFVWIEHANGEWTKYTHMQTGSVIAAGRTVGEWVPAGAALGTEGDIGIASGIHLHFEVAVPMYEYEALTDGLADDNLVEADPDIVLPDESNFFCRGFLRGDGIEDDVLFEDPDGDGDNDPDDDLNRQNRIPVFCQVGFAVDNASDTAVPCDDLCNNLSLDVVGTITPMDTPLYEQVVNDIGNMTGNLTIDPFAGVSFRSADTVTLSPGFHADGDSFFVASIGGCDTPGGTGE